MEISWNGSSAASLGGESVAGHAMKSTSGWNSGSNGSNSSGFTGLPGGYRYSGGFYSDGYDGTGGLLQSPVPTHGYVYCTTTRHVYRDATVELRLFCSLRPGLKILNYSDAVARWQITSRA